VLLVVTAGAFLANLDLFIVNIAFPAIHADFAGVSLSELSWVLNGYAIVFAALLVPAGRLADRFGRKRFFLGGLTVFLVASVLCALAPSAWELIGARLVQAVGAAIMIPTSLALLLPEFPPHRRGAAVGLWTAGAAVAATCGPVLGGLLVAASWRWVFLVNIPIGAATAVAGVVVLRESREAERGPWPDLVGSVLLCVAIGALALGVVKGSQWGWESARFVVVEAIAVVGLGLFIRRTSRHTSPVVELALLRVKSARAANSAVFLFSMGFFPLLLATVLFLTGVWHYSVVQAGVAFAPGPLMVALFSWPAGMLVPRVGPRPLVIAGVSLFAAANLWWAFQATESPNYLTGMLPQLVLAGIGVALTFPVLAGTAVSALPPGRAATGSAVFNMARQIGGVVGVAILIAILGPSTPTLDEFRSGWVMMAVVALGAGVVAWTLRATAAPVRAGREVGAGPTTDATGDAVLADAEVTP